MSDLIERQAAVDAIYHHFPSVSRTRARTMLHEVPSVQPEKRTEERTKTHACNLIDRQAAIEVIDAVFPVDPMKTEYAQGIACGAALAKTYVEQLPSEQPERKTGRWVPVTNGRGGHECDKCHEYAPSWTTGEEHLTNFCPNCGADMRGGQE